MEQQIPTETEETGAATVQLSLEELIKKNVERIVALKQEAKEKAQMVKDSYESDSVYRDLDEKAKTARKAATTLKNQILEVPGNKKLAQEVKDIRLDLKERKVALSDYLVEYRRISGATQLELFDGSLADIVLSAKIVKVEVYND